MLTNKATPEIMRRTECFKSFMLEQEYKPSTAAKYIAHLSRFLQRTEGAKESILKTEITDFLEERRNVSPETFKECRAALHLYYWMQADEKLSKEPEEAHNPGIETIVKQFCDYSIDIRRLKPVSVEREVATVRLFLEHIGETDLSSYGDISAYEVRDFIVKRFSHLKGSTKSREVTALRNFFRFMKFTGVRVNESVFCLPLSPADWKNSAFPSTVDERVFDSLYRMPDESTPIGKRDRCIILCFTELALRCIEVSALTLDDFDWREGTVSIKNTKNRSDRKLPVPGKLNQAIIDYLRFSRPQTKSRVLFVRFKRVSGEPMRCSQIRGVVRRIFSKTEADIKSTGTHILRRAATTKLYNSGNSLKMTADILGHESLDSTARYAKADIANLRQVAATWPASKGKAGADDAQ